MYRCLLKWLFLSDGALGNKFLARRLFSLKLTRNQPGTHRILRGLIARSKLLDEMEWCVFLALRLVRFAVG